MSRGSLVFRRQLHIIAENGSEDGIIVGSYHQRVSFKLDINIFLKRAQREGDNLFDIRTCKIHYSRSGSERDFIIAVMKSYGIGFCTASTEEPLPCSFQLISRLSRLQIPDDPSLSEQATVAAMASHKLAVSRLIVIRSGVYGENVYPNTILYCCPGRFGHYAGMAYVTKTGITDRATAFPGINKDEVGTVFVAFKKRIVTGTRHININVIIPGNKTVMPYCTDEGAVC